MSGLDIIIAIVVLIGLWRGFQAGLIKTAVGLMGWFVALIAATRLATPIAPQLSLSCQSGTADGIGFFDSRDCYFSHHALLAFIFSSALKTLNLSVLDKVAGGVCSFKNTLMVLGTLSVRLYWYSCRSGRPQCLPLS